VPGLAGVTFGTPLPCGAPAWSPAIETRRRLAPDAEGMCLGTCMLILPLYEPLHVAEQFALLDAASGGRAIVGVAPGWTKDEFDIMRLDHGRRTGRFVEAVTLIKRLCTEQAGTFQGRHFQTSNL